MSEVLNDQEQEERVKKWIKTHGANTLSAILLGLSAYFGYQYYLGSKANENALASNDFQQVSEQQQRLQLLTMQSKPVPTAENTKFLANIDDIVKKYPDSVYAQQSLMLKAQYLVDKNELDKALTALEKAKTVKKDDAGIVNVISLRIAQVQIANNKAEEAVNLLKGIKNEAFLASKEELLGDAYVALKKNDDAKKSYEAAWLQSLKDDDESQVLRLKMETLGITPIEKLPEAATATDNAADKPKDNEEA